MTNYTRTIAGVTMALFAATACGKDDDRDTTMMGDSTAATASSGGTLSPDSTGTMTAGEIDIEGLELGRTVGSDGKIADETDDFKPNDEIVAVVETDDNEAGKELVARWTYGENEQVVSEERQTVAAGSEARTVFRLKKASAWPTGDYHVRIMHNGKEVKSKDFKVTK